MKRDQAYRDRHEKHTATLHALCKYGLLHPERVGSAVYGYHSY